MMDEEGLGIGMAQSGFHATTNGAISIRAISRLQDTSHSSRPAP
jgi:hypothetical protein